MLQKYLKTLLLIALLALVLPTSAALALNDPNDDLLLISPQPNAYVKDNVATRFVLEDNGQTQIPYELTLRDTSCVNPISNLANGQANSGQEVTVNWNSNGPVPGAASIADGKYCLEVCGTFQHNNSTYSGCSSRFVNIRNNNGAPNITTQPPADKTIFTDQSFRYDVNATDPEGDRLTFSLAEAPSFLSINPYTGLLTTNSRAKSAGDYRVVIRVVDGFENGTDSQSFTLSVRQRPAPPPPTSTSTTSTSTTTSATTTTTTSTTTTTTTTTTTSSTSSATSTIDPSQVNITFSSPESRAEFVTEAESVSWQIQGLETQDIVDLKLGLLIDNELEQLGDLEVDSREYSFDATTYEPGEYRFQLDVETDAQIFSQQSPTFVIPDSEDEEPPTEARPVISNFTPEDGSTVDNLRPTIGGEFTSPEDADLDLSSFEFFLDTVQRDWCSNVTQEGFVCNPSADLQPGEHVVRVAITDTEGRLGVTEWRFTVAEPSEAGEDTINILGYVIPTQTLITICGGGLALLLLFVIPWVLFSIWSRRQEPTTYDDQSGTSPNDGYDSGGIGETNYSQTDYATNPSTDNIDQSQTDLDPNNLVSITDQIGSDTAASGANTDYLQPADYGFDETDESTDEQDSYATPDQAQDQSHSGEFADNTTGVGGVGAVQPQQTSTTDDYSQQQTDMGGAGQQTEQVPTNNQDMVSASASASGSEASAGESSSSVGAGVSTSAQSQDIYDENGEIDPLKFDSYEDYLAAVGEAGKQGAQSGDNSKGSASSGQDQNSKSDLMTANPGN